MNRSLSADVSSLSADLDTAKEQIDKLVAAVAHHSELSPHAAQALLEEAGLGGTRDVAREREDVREPIEPLQLEMPSDDEASTE